MSIYYWPKWYILKGSLHIQLVNNKYNLFGVKVIMVDRQYKLSVVDLGLYCYHDEVLLPVEIYDGQVDLKELHENYEIVEVELGKDWE